MSENILSWVVMVFFIMVIMSLLSTHQMGLTARVYIMKAEKEVREIERWAKETKNKTLNAISKYGRKKEDIYGELGRFMDFFAIDPCRDEPIGIMSKLEHILDTSEERFEDQIISLAPNANAEERANLEPCVGATLAVNLIRKVLTHLLSIAKKTNNISLAMVLHMQMPLIKQIVKSYSDAAEVFAKGVPIGDALGPLVAVTLVGGEAKYREPVKDTVYTTLKYEGRNVFVAKAKGPGGRVGKPGELAKYVLNKHKIKRVITIDAALKLEGEKSGEVSEGVGTAIGGPPVDKYKVETISTEKKVPVDAIVVKQSLGEALGPMTLATFKSAEEVAETVRQTILKKTKKEDGVLVLGIGNTLGIGQTLPIKQKTFPLSLGSEKEIESPILAGVIQTVPLGSPQKTIRLRRGAISFPKDKLCPFSLS
jgi:hypothetical protein